MRACARRESNSKQLISQDDKSNIKNYKFTLYAEIAPICKDDLCILDPKLAQLLGETGFVETFLPSAELALDRSSGCVSDPLRFALQVACLR